MLFRSESITGTHNLPIGQVLFVPREEIALKECAPAEVEALQQAREAFARGKAGDKLKTPYGLEYSPFYLKVSRAQAQAARGAQSEEPAEQPQAGPDSPEKA